MLRRYPFLDNKWEPSFRGQVSEIMRPGADLHCLSLNGRNTIRSLREFASQHAYTGYPIITSPDENRAL